MQKSAVNLDEKLKSEKCEISPLLSKTVLVT
jgi:hypothetical protein